MTCKDDSDRQSETPGGLEGGGGGSRASNTVRWALGAAAISTVVVIAARRGEASQLARLLRTIRPGWILAALVLQAGTYACDAWIWRVVLSRVGCPQPFWRMFLFAISRVFVTQAVPSAGVSGDVMVVRALQRRGVPLDALMTALLVNLFGFYAAFAGCAVVAGFILHVRGGVNRSIFAIVLPFSAVLLAVPGLIGWLVRSSHESRRSRSWWNRVPGIAQLREVLGQARMDLLHDHCLMGESTVAQIATFSLDAGTLYVMLLALGHATPAANVFAAFMLASAAELVGPLPGGLGAFEGGAIIGLGAFGVPIETALLATLLLRGFTFWLPMIPGSLIARSAFRGPAPTRGGATVPRARGSSMSAGRAMCLVARGRKR